MADEEHVAILKKGVATWNLWRGANAHIRPDLSGANLIESYLIAANLNGADLSGAKLGAAYLSEANLLVLLCHKFRYLFRAAQHGQRDSIVARAATNLRRIVAIEFGTWRSGRNGGSSGLVTFA